MEATYWSFVIFLGLGTLLFFLIIKFLVFLFDNYDVIAFTFDVFIGIVISAIFTLIWGVCRFFYLLCFYERKIESGKVITVFIKRDEFDSKKRRYFVFLKSVDNVRKRIKIDKNNFELIQKTREDGKDFSVVIHLKRNLILGKQIEKFNIEPGILI